MSRFGPSDQFYVRMAQAESDDRVRRVVALGPILYGCFLDQPTPPAIVDHDPGDEDRGAL